MREAIEHVGNRGRKPLFRDVVPVRLLHRASGRADAADRSPGTIGPLLPRRRIILFENVLHLQVELLRSALVAEKERLLPVADENEGVVGNGRF